MSDFGDVLDITNDYSEASWDSDGLIIDLTSPSSPQEALQTQHQVVERDQVGFPRNVDLEVSNKILHCLLAQNEQPTMENCGGHMVECPRVSGFLMKILSGGNLNPGLSLFTSQKVQIVYWDGEKYIGLIDDKICMVEPDSAQFCFSCAHGCKHQFWCEHAIALLCFVDIWNEKVGFGEMDDGLKSALQDGMDGTFDLLPIQTAQKDVEELAQSFHECLAECMGITPAHRQKAEHLCQIIDVTCVLDGPVAALRLLESVFPNEDHRFVDYIRFEKTCVFLATCLRQQSISVPSVLKCSFDFETKMQVEQVKYLDCQGFFAQAVDLARDTCPSLLFSLSVFHGDLVDSVTYLQAHLKTDLVDLVSFLNIAKLLDPTIAIYAAFCAFKEFPSEFPKVWNIVTDIVFEQYSHALSAFSYSSATPSLCELAMKQHFDSLSGIQILQLSLKEFQAVVTNHFPFDGHFVVFAICHAVSSLRYHSDFSPFITKAMEMKYYEFCEIFLLTVCQSKPTKSRFKLLSNFFKSTGRSKTFHDKVIEICCDALLCPEGHDNSLVADVMDSIHYFYISGKFFTKLRTKFLSCTPSQSTIQSLWGMICELYQKSQQFNFDLPKLCIEMDLIPISQSSKFLSDCFEHEERIAAQTKQRQRKQNERHRGHVATRSFSARENAFLRILGTVTKSHFDVQMPGGFLVDFCNGIFQKACTGNMPCCDLVIELLFKQLKHHPSRLSEWDIKRCFESMTSMHKLFFGGLVLFMCGLKNEFHECVCLLSLYDLPLKHQLALKNFGLQLCETGHKGTLFKKQGEITSENMVMHFRSCFEQNPSFLLKAHNLQGTTLNVTQITQAFLESPLKCSPPHISSMFQWLLKTQETFELSFKIANLVLSSEQMQPSAISDIIKSYSDFESRRNWSSWDTIQRSHTFESVILQKLGVGIKGEHDACPESLLDNHSLFIEWLKMCVEHSLTHQISHPIVLTLLSGLSKPDHVAEIDICSLQEKLENPLFVFGILQVAVFVWDHSVIEQLGLRFISQQPNVDSLYSLVNLLRNKQFYKKPKRMEPKEQGSCVVMDDDSCKTSQVLIANLLAEIYVSKSDVTFMVVHNTLCDLEIPPRLFVETLSHHFEHLTLKKAYDLSCFFVKNKMFDESCLVAHAFLAKPVVQAGAFITNFIEMFFVGKNNCARDYENLYQQDHRNVAKSLDLGYSRQPSGAVNRDVLIGTLHHAALCVLSPTHAIPLLPQSLHQFSGFVDWFRTLAQSIQTGLLSSHFISLSNILTLSSFCKQYNSEYSFGKKLKFNPSFTLPMIDMTHFSISELVMCCHIYHQVDPKVAFQRACRLLWLKNSEVEILEHVRTLEVGTEQDKPSSDSKTQQKFEASVDLAKNVEENNKIVEQMYALFSACPMSSLFGRNDLLSKYSQIITHFISVMGISVSLFVEKFLSSPLSTSLPHIHALTSQQFSPKDFGAIWPLAEFLVENEKPQEAKNFIHNYHNTFLNDESYRLALKSGFFMACLWKVVDPTYEHMIEPQYEKCVEEHFHFVQWFGKLVQKQSQKGLTNWKNDTKSIFRMLFGGKSDHRIAWWTPFKMPSILPLSSLSEVQLAAALDVAVMGENLGAATEIASHIFKQDPTMNTYVLLKDAICHDYKFTATHFFTPAKILLALSQLAEQLKLSDRFEISRAAWKVHEQANMHYDPFHGNESLRWLDTMQHSSHINDNWR